MFVPGFITNRINFFKFLDGCTLTCDHIKHRTKRDRSYLQKGNVLMFVLVFITNHINFLSFLMDVHRPAIILNTELKGTGATYKKEMF